MYPVKDLWHYINQFYYITTYNSIITDLQRYDTIESVDEMSYVLKIFTVDKMGWDNNNEKDWGDFTCV